MWRALDDDEPAAWRAARWAMVASSLCLASACSDGNTRIDYPAVYVVNAGGPSLSVIDLGRQEPRRTLPLEGVSWPHHINLSPDQARVAIGVPGMDLSGGHENLMAMPGKLMVLDAATGEAIRTIDLPAMNHNAAFSPDGSEIWTSQMQMEGAVRVYDANTFTLETSIAVGSMPQEVTFSSDGSMAFVACNMSDNVVIIDVTTKAVMGTVSVGKGPVGAWPGSNAKMYVDSEEGQSISVIDVASMTVEESVPLEFTPGYAAYTAGRDELWVSDATHGSVVYYQRMNGQWTSRGSISTGEDAHAIAFTPDGGTAYVTNQMAGTVSVIDAIAKTKVKDIVVGVKPNGMVLRE